MDKIKTLVKDSLVFYDSEKEFLKENEIDSSDFEKWKKQGYSDDGFIDIMDCYCLAGNATTGGMQLITNLDEIVDLLWCEINETDFVSDTVGLLNDDLKGEVSSNYKKDYRYINPNDAYQIMEAFIEFIDSGYGEIAIFKNESGKYKNGYCLVIIND